MNKLDQIKLKIFESYDREMITESEKDELLYIIEKKTQEHYSRESFKKKYHFVPDKPGSDKGTITINGEKRHVDIGKTKYAEFADTFVTRQTMADIGGENGDILIDKNFFKLKNDKRRDAVLQHEFGHTKLHPMNGESKTADPRTFSPKNKGISRRTIFNNGKKSLAEFGYSMSDKNNRKMLNDTIDDQCKNSEKYKERSDKNEYRKKREELLKHASKYVSKGSSHANEQEFEADKYAANKAGTKNLKSGIREYTRMYKKDYKKAKIPKEAIKDFNKETYTDLKARSKALKDKKLRDADLYK